MFLHLSVILFTGGSATHPWADPLDRHPPGQTPLWVDIPPAQNMLGYGQQAGDMHPTEMHSCLNYVLFRTLY